ncbi:MAG: monothiol glutaredoxin grx5 [Trizodia sp. TS-e1964]|nr:MAG: monothiol glutaredoxin grx5 [Trizodia sp. TS-e1964]
MFARPACLVVFRPANRFQAVQALSQKTTPRFSPLKTAATRALSHETRSAISKAIESAPVVLFMKGTPDAPQCGYSRATLQILAMQGVDPARFTAYNVLEDEELRSENLNEARELLLESSRARLETSSSTLLARLAALASNSNALLAHTASTQSLLFAPLEAEALSITHVDGAGAATVASVMLGERVKTFRVEVGACKAALQALFREWHAVQVQLERLGRDLMAGEGAWVGELEASKESFRAGVEALKGRVVLGAARTAEGMVESEKALDHTSSHLQTNVLKAFLEGV